MTIDLLPSAFMLPPHCVTAWQSNHQTLQAYLPQILIQQQPGIQLARKPVTVAKTLGPLPI
jgi:hypothetical protein